MYKKPLIVLAFLLLLATLLLSSLLASSDDISNKAKGFVRNIHADILSADSTINRPVKVNRIAGATDHSLFFIGDNPNYLLRTDYQLSCIDSIVIPIKFYQYILSAYRLTVDSPMISIYANNKAQVFKLQMGSRKIDTVNLLTKLFTRSVPISNNGVVVRAFDKRDRGLFFFNVNTVTGEVRTRQEIIENSTDLGITTDGILEYDDQTHLLAYVQYFRNAFYCFDTSLRLKYIGHSIDTNKVATIGDAMFVGKNGKGKLMSSTPKKAINKWCATYNSRLYLASGLMADNEEKHEFETNSVIDIYDLQTGSYENSFYIPLDKEGQRLRAFDFFNNSLVVVYPSSIAVFKLVANNIIFRRPSR